MRDATANAFTNTGDPLRSKSTATVRLYILDQMILSLVTREGYAYAATLAEKLNRTQRTINKHLSKLEEFYLIERHGRIRCPFQWYSINEKAKPQTLELIFFLHGRFATKTPQKSQYVIFEKLLDHVPNGGVGLRSKDGTVELTFPDPRKRHDPGRPFDRSIPWIPFCKRYSACPFPLCVRHCNPRDSVEAALLSHCPFRNGENTSSGER